MKQFSQGCGAIYYMEVHWKNCCAAVLPAGLFAPQGSGKSDSSIVRDSAPPERDELTVASVRGVPEDLWQRSACLDAASIEREDSKRVD